MKITEDKKLNIRTDIINGIEKYKEKLAGKYFLYIFDGRYIEIYFGRDNFKHLTGVKSNLNAEDFYSKAEDKILTTSQFGFNKEHPYRNAKKKCSRLIDLHKLIYEDTILLENLKTDSYKFSFGTTNLDFTIGFSERTKMKNGKEITIPHQYIPRTLRIKDDGFEKSENVYEVDFIFSKDNDDKLYNELTFGKMENVSIIPDEICSLIDDKFFK